ncbi:MAG: hypothetical protein V3T88_08700, partial [Nitrosomonadaceae bacterium]
TPDYDQAVYRYKRQSDDLEFMWVVPSYDTVNLMKSNVHNVPSDQYSLLNYVLKFEDGTLLRLAKKLNGEQGDTSLLA